MTNVKSSYLMLRLMLRYTSPLDAWSFTMLLRLLACVCIQPDILLHGKLQLLAIEIELAKKIVCVTVG